MLTPSACFRAICQAIMLGGLLLSAACGAQGQATSQGRTTLAGPEAAQTGRPATDFTLTSLAGETIRLSDLRGRPVLLHFWATWCPPCREEMPRLVTGAREYQPQGLVVLAVTLDSDREEVVRFADEFHLSFPILFDSDNAVADRYRVRGIPTSFFIGPDGTIRTVVSGPLTTSALARHIASILEAKP